MCESSFGIPSMVFSARFSKIEFDAAKVYFEYNSDQDFASGYHSRDFGTDWMDAFFQ